MEGHAEHAITERLTVADGAGAGTLALRAWGPEVYGYRRSLHRDPDDADEVFSLFSLFTEAPLRSASRSHWGS